MAHSTPTTTRLMRLPEVMRTTGLGRSAIYSAMGTGTFPKAVHLARKAVAWPSNEIADWVAARVRERDAR